MSQLPHATHTPGSRPVGGAHACLPADRLTGPERALLRILPTGYARGSNEPDSECIDRNFLPRWALTSNTANQSAFHKHPIEVGLTPRQRNGLEEAARQMSLC